MGKISIFREISMKKFIFLAIVACTPLFIATSQRREYFDGIRPQTGYVGEAQKWATLSARRDVYTAMTYLDLPDNLTKKALATTDMGLSRLLHTAKAQEQKLSRSTDFDSTHYDEQVNRCLSKLLDPQLVKRIEAEMLRQSR